MTTEPLWQWHENLTRPQTLCEPEEWAIFLEADCEIEIGDIGHVEDDEESEYSDLSIKEYFLRYINSNKKEIERMSIATVKINDCVCKRFDKVWDLKVIEGMTIFIESEEF